MRSSSGAGSGDKTRQSFGGAGIAIGVSLGIIFGMLFGHIPVGIAVGAAVGLVMEPRVGGQLGKKAG